jgi:hypothetical protein
VERSGLDSCGSGYRPVAGSCEHGNEPSGSIKGREFLSFSNNTSNATIIFMWFGKVKILLFYIYSD